MAKHSLDDNYISISDFLFCKLGLFLSLDLHLRMVPMTDRCTICLRIFFITSPRLEKAEQGRGTIRGSINI